MLARMRILGLALALTLGCQVGERPRGRPGAPSASAPRAIDPRERVAFLRGGAVWTMRPDGGDPRALTVRPPDQADERPALSPDGRWIAFASAHGGLHRVYLMSLTELLPVAVTDGGELGDGEPAFSPDGATLYFARGDGRERKDLYRVDVAAALAAGERGAPPPLPELLLAGDDDDPEQAGTPVATPDGRALLFAADRRRGEGTGVWRLELASRRLGRVTPPGTARTLDREPAVSPDGRTIVFASNRHVGPAGDDDFALYRIASDGSRLARLTDEPGSATDPAYAPDGTRIYFVARDEAGSSIAVVPAAGGAARPVSGGRDDEAPSAALLR